MAIVASADGTVDPKSQIEKHGCSHKKIVARVFFFFFLYLHRKSRGYLFMDYIDEQSKFLTYFSLSISIVPIKTQALNEITSTQGKNGKGRHMTKT